MSDQSGPAADAADVAGPAARARQAAAVHRLERLQAQQENVLAMMAVADRLHDERVDALRALVRSPDSGAVAVGAVGTRPAPPPGVAGTGEAAQPEPSRGDGSTAQAPPRGALSWPAGLPRTPGGVRCLRVLLICDDVAFQLIQPECHVRRLVDAPWQEALADHDPHLLLVDSGEARSTARWGDAEGRPAAGLLALLAACRERGVATALWDGQPAPLPAPALAAARAYDHLFTVDLARIPGYRAELGDSVGVHWLPGAVQAVQHNPVTSGTRAEALALVRRAGPAAGSAEVDDRPDVAHDLRRWRPTSEVQCGAAGASDAGHRFRYAFLPAADPQAQVLVDQAVLELLAAGALVASTFAQSLRVVLGELVSCADVGAQLVGMLQARADDRLLAERVRLLALRRVLGEHTWQDRLTLLSERVWGVSIDPRPEVLVLCVVDTEADVDRALGLFGAQVHPAKQLCLVAGGDLAVRDLPRGVHWVPGRVGQDLAGVVAACRAGLDREPDWVAVLDVRDHYGPDYLTDLVVATRYSGGRAVGKPPEGFRWVDGQLRMPEWESAHRRCTRLALRSSMAPLSALDDVGGIDLAREQTSAMLPGVATDHFHYCRDGAQLGSTPGVAVVDVDRHILDTGVPLARLLELEGRLGADAGPQVLGRMLPGAGLELPLSQQPPDRPVTVLTAADGTLHCESGLPEDEHIYVYSAGTRSLSDLGVSGELRLHLPATGGLAVQVVALFLDEAGSRIGHLLGPANRNLRARVPGRARALRLGVRVQGSGSARLDALVLGTREAAPPLVVARSRHLLVTDHYPATGDLYRNAFIHRRVRAYQDRGVRVDVFAVGPDRPFRFEEFDGVGVIRGSLAALSRLLQQHDYDHILVHFMTEDLWSALAPRARHVPVTVWVHGAEINPWWRRPFNLVAPGDRERVVESSDARRRFWRELLGEQLPQLRFVFVSRTFAGEAFEDLGIDPDRVRWTVIHNPIDTTLFAAGAKPPEARLKVWSIRPFASEKYANDLTVEALLEMSARPEFQDMEFLIVGDGPLFEATTAPLAGLPNVVVIRGFLTQEQIADLHAQHGVFLVPTRWDSQGVSRDEAMSMGLVPITNAVAAVPEFVDDSCAILCPPEDSSAMVDGLLRLHRDPQLFHAMSQAAMRRVRAQSGIAGITDAELALFAGPAAPPGG